MSKNNKNLVELENKDECVKVMVRCRPMNTKEQSNGSRNCITCEKDINQIVLTHPSEESDINGRGFTFDAVYGEGST